ncbi:MAG: hypothetical protein LC105_08010 [Chitinophagales bacterium]|nr:hypothetical protein [Chitinophagales bacterium]MCZ2393783.1 hypothetical protein [Chitinophagales bacterium]
MLSNSTIRTYLNDTLQETTGGGVSLLEAPLLGGSSRYVAGFITSKPFNEIRYTINQPAGIGFGTTNIYYAVAKKYCEGDSLECNDYTRLSVPNHPVDIDINNTGLTGLACVGCSVNNPGRILDNDTSNFANINLIAGVGSTGRISVKNGYGPYRADSIPMWAGFEISTGQLITLNILNNISIKTYLKDSLIESSSPATLFVDGDIFSSTGRHFVGFKVTKSFDEIEFSVTNTGGDIGTTNVYAAAVKRYCKGPDLECNKYTKLTQPTHPVDLDINKLGISGIACVLCDVKDPGKILDSNPDNYAIIDLVAGVGSTGTISVRNGYGSYRGDTIPMWAGFEISTAQLITANILNNVTISTYLNGVFRESSTAATLFVEGDVFSASERQFVGFKVTKEFDEIVYSVTNTGGDIGLTNVYSAAVRKYCDTPLSCNIETREYVPAYPVDINYHRTGNEGLACALCGVDNPNRVIDESDSNFAQIYVPVGVAGGAGISVRNGYGPYPAGTYAAFEVSKTNLIDVAALGGVTIELYKNNQLVQSGTGVSEIVSGNSTILSSTDHRLVGIVSNVEFDEARIVIRNVGQVNLGTTNVYNFYVMKGCPGEFDCQTSTALIRPDYAVVIEDSRTGINSGVACVGCTVNRPDFVINSDSLDVSTINLLAGGLGTSGSISVRDLSIVYPSGTLAGFVVRDPNPIIQAGLLSGITIQTYLNGSLQETKSGGGALIDVNALLPWLGVGSGKHAIGFNTSNPFNEIRITYTTLVQGLSYLDVYYAFADARYVSGSGFDCFAYIDAVNDINQTPVIHL